MRSSPNKKCILFYKQLCVRGGHCIGYERSLTTTYLSKQQSQYIEIIINNIIIDQYYNHYNRGMFDFSLVINWISVRPCVHRSDRRRPLIKFAVWLEDCKACACRCFNVTTHIVQICYILLYIVQICFNARSHGSCHQKGSLGSL